MRIPDRDNLEYYIIQEYTNVALAFTMDEFLKQNQDYRCTGGPVFINGSWAQAVEKIK